MISTKLRNSERRTEEFGQSESPEAQLGIICARFQDHKLIYTNIGELDLLALNPWEQLPIYDSAVLSQYLPREYSSSDGSKHHPSPLDHSFDAHIFATASRALKTVWGAAANSAKNGAEAAALVFCGEAGAGKTANLFHALRYLAFVNEQNGGARGGGNCPDQRNVLSCEAVDALERTLISFGSAKTLKNPRSTRHAYIVELHYKGNSIVGISIDSPVPLETSRIVGQRKGERNYAIFYQLCCGLNAEQRERLGLSSKTDKYFYLNQQQQSAEVDTSKDALEFAEMEKALSRVGFSVHQKELIWRLLAAILHLGNVFFKAQMEEVAELANEAELRWVALLLQIDFCSLKHMLTHSTNGQQRNVESALDVRDALAKTIYWELFKWLLHHVELFFKTSSANDRENRAKIALIDVPGFERSGNLNNGYEEFCSNLVSEQLEQFFQKQRFGQFRDEEFQHVVNYGRLQPPHHWPNNERILDLLLKRPVGVLPLLNDECKFPRGSDETFLQHCNINHLDKSIYVKARVKGHLELGIRHQFGLCFYNVDGFLAKNRFSQPAAIFAMLARSKDPSLSAIFAGKLAEMREDRWVNVADEWHHGIRKLCERMNGINTIHFVRCVRVNNDRIPGKLDPKAVQRQLRALSLSDHCLATRIGFEHKVPIAIFADSFRALLPDEIVHDRTACQIARDVLSAQGNRFVNQAIFGPNHVFLKETLYAQLCELKLFTLNLAAVIIQRNVRKFIARRFFELRREAITRIQAAYRGWKCRREMAEFRERIAWTKRRRSTRRAEGAGNGKIDENSKWAQFGHYSRYIGCSSTMMHHHNNTSSPSSDAPTVALEKFATEHIKHVPLGARREPILAPFLPKDSEDEFDKSLALFKLILRYQFETENADQFNQFILAKSIVQHGIRMSSLRDELFIQLINQTHNTNNSVGPMALNRAWTLLLCSLNSFPPSELIFPIIYSHCHAQPSPLSRMLLNGLRNNSNISNSSRNVGPSFLEQNAAVQRRFPLISVQFVDGNLCRVAMGARTTAEGLARTLLRERGICDPFGWCLELDNGIRCTQIHSTLIPFDAIAHMEEEQLGLADIGPPNIESAFAFFDSPKCIGEETFTKTQNEKDFNGQGQNQQRAKQRTFGKESVIIGNNQDECPSKQWEGNGQFQQPAIRHSMGAKGRFDPRVQLRWNLNANCMSRIMEREEDAISINGGGTDGGHRRQQSSHSSTAEGSLARIRRMPVPNSESGLDQFLDDVFEQALPSSYELLESNPIEEKPKFDRVIIGKLAASIKGDDFYEPIPVDASFGREQRQKHWQRVPPLPMSSDRTEEQAPQWREGGTAAQRRFIYRAGGGIFVEQQNGTEGEEGRKEPDDEEEEEEQQQQHHAYQTIGTPCSTTIGEGGNGEYQPNGEYHRSTKRRESADGHGHGHHHPFVAHHSPPQPITTTTTTVNNNNNKHPFGINAFGHFIHQTHNVPFYNPTGKCWENEMQNGEEEDDHCWVPETEQTLNEMLFGTSNNWGIGTTNVYASTAGEGRRSTAKKEEIGMPKKSANGRGKAAAAVGYTEQPFELVLRKDLFATGEVLDDGAEIDLVFAQIVRDCRRQLRQMRIRRYEREAVQQLLRSYNIPPKALNNPAQIPTNVKLEVIGIVRKWPLYFCRLFSVVEERPNGRVPLLLGVAESGIRLISVSRSYRNGGDGLAMTIQDHFEWCDIAELMLENEDRALRMVTRQNIAILLTGPKLREAKQCMDRFVFGGAKRNHFVIAISDYNTRETNMLSFESGDYIQIVEQPDSDRPSTGSWLYGKVDGQFGWLPAEYVVDANAKAEEEQVYSSSCYGEMAMGLYNTGSMDSSFALGEFKNGNGTAHQHYRHAFASAGIPPVLDSLFTNIDASLLFRADHQQRMGANEHFTLLEFALRFFRHPKGSFGTAKTANARGSNAEGAAWPPGWREMADRLKFSERPIAHSLLRLESHEADRVAQQSFLAIMRFMGDEPLKRNQSFSDCVHELLSLCHAYLPIRDEVYCQLIKQITANKSQKCSSSAIRGWRLLGILCAYFVCSDTLKPYLVKFLGHIAFDVTGFSPATDLAKIAIYNLAQTFRYGGRRLILAAAEVQAIANGQSVRCQWYHLPGGHRRLINTRAVTVAEEIVRTLCLEMNIRSAAEQQEFSLCYILSKDNSVHTLLNDEYAMDVCTELETRRDTFLLLLTRSVWLHPLRRDSDLCTDALFFQLMPNYLAGLLFSLREDGTATAAILDDVAMLAALLMISNSQQIKQSDLENHPSVVLPNLIPRNLLNCISFEQWVRRICDRADRIAISEEFSPVKARQQFLEIVERWPLFGAAFYFVRRVFSGKQGSSSMPGAAVLAQNCVLSINKFGMRVLAHGTHQILAELALDEINEMAKYSLSDINFLEFRLSSQGTVKHGTEVVTVETELGNEISRLIGHYIFLNNGNGNKHPPAAAEANKLG